jgi:molecular chaperone GrpE
MIVLMKDDENINKNNEEVNIEDELKSNIVGSLDTSDEVYSDDVSFVESTEDGEALPTRDIVKKLREENKTLRKEKEEYLTGWQRAKADYINLQKELESVRINSDIYSKEKMAEKLFSALDSFDMAIADKTHWEKIDKDWQNGILSIQQQFLRGLEKSGIKKIDEVSVLFDPNLHQSISLVETDDEKKDHTIANILQAGYKISDISNSTGQDRIIRPAKVIIYEYKK